MKMRRATHQECDQQATFSAEIIRELSEDHAETDKSLFK